MLSLTDLIGNIMFPGFPTNTAYDFIKVIWEKSTNKSWEDLYLDAFQAALNEAKPQLEKYAREGGDTGIDREVLYKALHQELAVAPETWSYSQPSDNMFIHKLARAMAAHRVLVIGGNVLSEDDYSQLIYNLVSIARALFKEALLNNDQAFRQILLEESLSHQTLVRQVQEYLVNQFDLQVLEQLKVLEDKVDNVAASARQIQVSMILLGKEKGMSLQSKYLSASWLKSIIDAITKVV